MMICFTGSHGSEPTIVTTRVIDGAARAQMVGGRLPGCQSRHAGNCYGEVEPCSRCGRRRCMAEGTTDLVSLCDDCWAHRRAREAECRDCGWRGPPQASCPACKSVDLAQVSLASRPAILNSLRVLAAQTVMGWDPCSSAAALRDAPPLVRTLQACLACGCTEHHACPEGCWWVTPQLCSCCADEGDVVAAQVRGGARPSRLRGPARHHTRTLTRPELHPWAPLCCSMEVL